MKMLMKEFQNKNVVVVCKDKYKKIGILREFSDSGILLEFFNGKKQFIQMNEVAHISEMREDIT